jgi:hypothetical protein
MRGSVYTALEALRNFRGVGCSCLGGGLALEMLEGDQLDMDCTVPSR